MTNLSVDIRHGFASNADRRDPDAEAGFSLDIHFKSQSRSIALAGPSGSGKSTILHIIAGLLKPDAARIIVGGDTLVDTAQGLVLPTSQRRIGYVFQDGRLFPHLTVQKNLMFGQWFSYGRENAIGMSEVVDLLGISHLLHRRPASLSGGEKQRVAIGRALLSRPRLLLMDEPLAALDVARRQQILPLIERIRDEISIPIVFVSHDPAEINRIGIDIVQIENGSVVTTDGDGKSAKITRLDNYRNVTPSNTVSGK